MSETGAPSARGGSDWDTGGEELLCCLPGAARQRFCPRSAGGTTQGVPRLRCDSAAVARFDLCTPVKQVRRLCAARGSELSS